MSATSLVLGPMLRHVSRTTATVWVQTAAAATVTVSSQGRSWSARTFGVEGFHYALVVIEGLEPGTVQDYTVAVDGEVVWPEPGSAFPGSRIATLSQDQAPRLAFGSCRTSVPHDRAATATHGVDAMRAYALDMAAHPQIRSWPDVLVLLGDQVYADDISPRMADFIEQRRGGDSEPVGELKDFTEYAHLYLIAWSEPANRWLFSTVPSAMIFDDHDVRDDWNTSAAWHEQINRLPWWHERLVGALTSYWVYQHLGNLAPDELAADPVWQQVMEHQRSGAEDELDLTGPLRDLAERVDQDPQAYRFSYTRDLGRARLVMVDSRAARDLRPEHRAMLDAEEEAWLDGELHGDTEHLFIGTSLPFLMPPGLHDLEAIDEAVCDGAFGPRAARAGERLRQAVDLEHWGAFQASFTRVMDMVAEVARGQRGRAPRTVTFLSGDVHHSYVAEIPWQDNGFESRVLQAVCSPIRNPLPRHVRALTAVLGRGLARPMRWFAGRSAKVPDPAYPWALTYGPWFDNNLAIADVRDDGALTLTWVTGEVTGEEYDAPHLRAVADVVVPATIIARVEPGQPAAQH